MLILAAALLCIVVAVAIDAALLSCLPLCAVCCLLALEIVAVIAQRIFQNIIVTHTQCCTKSLSLVVPFKCELLQRIYIQFITIKVIYATFLISSFSETRYYYI